MRAMPALDLTGLESVGDIPLSPRRHPPRGGIKNPRAQMHDHVRRPLARAGAARLFSEGVGHQHDHREH